MTTVTTAPPTDTPPAAPEYLLPVGEQRVFLEGISWQTYERLLSELTGHSSPRLTFNSGALEIMSPLLPAHEKPNRLLASLVETLAEEWQIEVVNFGSTTFKRRDMEKGAEPDTCFYFTHLDWAAAAERVDLDGGDPAPNLVIEVDITSPSLPRLPIYAALGVQEVWRFTGSEIAILLQQDGAYQQSVRSHWLPRLGTDTLANLLTQGGTLRRLEWLRAVRAWAREQA